MNTNENKVFTSDRRALEVLWKMLGAGNQTEAVWRLKAILAAAKQEDGAA